MTLNDTELPLCTVFKWEQAANIRRKEDKLHIVSLGTVSGNIA